jgi:5-methylcytosine-specific restriction endonuclease McrA
MDTKRCRRCEQVKSVEQFYKLKKDRPWRASTCIPCNKVISTEYQRNHREARNEAVKRWEQRNPFRSRLMDMEKTARFNRKKAGLHVEKVDYQEILDRDGWRCYLCGEGVIECNLSFDHVIPMLRGGPHTADNIRVVHIRCNDSKGGKLAAEARWMGHSLIGDPSACHRQECPEHKPPLG